MALEGPRLFYPLSTDLTEGDATLARALKLAREVEDLLEERTATSDGADASGAHSPRIARALAASLVDELEAIVRGARRTAGLS